MIEAQIKSVQCMSPAGLHKMAYKEWGDPRNRNLLVCVHGVTRVSDDFDRLAAALSDAYRVICPDVAGRGRSDQLAMPQLYHLPQYVGDMVTLLARADAEHVHWVGTSMGGLIGMVLASLPDSPVARLVLNDVGPALNPQALARIGTYIGEDIRFDSLDDGVRYIREISTSFGPHGDGEWRKLAADALRQGKDGRWMKHYDLRIADAFRTLTEEGARQAETMLWRAYDAIRCPTLLLRGADSDLLAPETAHAMTLRGPKARLVEFAGIGHAPTLMHDDQVAVVTDFLLG
ncbi:MAG TPA: alpha/beta hydrolase [Noviherbaspirillum sp.]|jgi:pimeloyl-ACP methyl ester carboxylesterase|uniref:alpha/beta fold hydrolase n=1 Tax=Noviherbaspirillum sp. TaxID=1926288 RepID=UPI002F948769